MDDFIYLVWSAKMKKERGRKRKKGKKTGYFFLIKF
jgi:hypothetical protein